MAERQDLLLLRVSCLQCHNEWGIDSTEQFSIKIFSKSVLWKHIYLHASCYFFTEAQVTRPG